MTQEILSHIRLPEGLRFISFEDVGKSFFTVEQLMDRHDLEYYYRRSLEPDSLVLVKEQGNEVAGLTLLIVDSEKIVIEMLTRKRRLSTPGVGQALLVSVESQIADQLQINEVRLESLDRPKLVKFYRRNGYVDSGPPKMDSEWGVLHPMVKHIATFSA